MSHVPQEQTLLSKTSQRTQANSRSAARHARAKSFRVLNLFNFSELCELGTIISHQRRSRAVKSLA